MTIKEARELFPHLKTDQVYFNHAAIGPWSSLVLNRISEYTSQRSSAQIENYKYTLEWGARAKIKLANLIGAKPERIAWIDNVSNAINILAQGLEWKTGDRIILNDIEFPSNVYPFLNLAKLGIEIDFAKSRNGVVDVEDIEKLITSKTKLVSISLVQFLSGYRANVSAIGELCKKHGIIFSVDAIQATGVVEIDVKKSKIDYLTGGSQKWLMSSQGLSYLFITEELQQRLNQKNVGWASVANAWNLLNYDLTLKTNADRFQNGTINQFGISVFDAALNMFEAVGIKNIERQILENSDYFINRLNEIGLDPILKNTKASQRAGIVSFKDDNSEQIFSKLEEKRIYCAVREGMVRFSPHFYNTKEEIDKVIEALENFRKG